MLLLKTTSTLTSAATFNPLVGPLPQPAGSAGPAGSAYALPPAEGPLARRPAAAECSLPQPAAALPPAEGPLPSAEGPLPQPAALPPAEGPLPSAEGPLPLPQPAAALPQTENLVNVDKTICQVFLVGPRSALSSAEGPLSLPQTAERQSPLPQPAGPAVPLPAAALSPPEH